VAVHAILVVAQVAAAVLAADTGAPGRASLPSPRGDSGAATTRSVAPATPAYRPEWLLGASGKLRACFVSDVRNVLAIPLLRRYFGDTAPSRPGVYPLGDSALGTPFSVITLLPFKTKARGRVGGYRLGWWPGERRGLRSEAYENPDGFIIVTPENQNTQVSEHFMLRDFLTHDQEGIWPKYLVLSEALVDKLELIIDDLESHGHPNAHLAILSGFRTPEYNLLGVGRHGGRARDSRHQFGDAADIYVDNDGDGIMDDLNGDGRIDSRDARVLLASVERVEAAHPELVGGAGVYRGTRMHGPFLHVDVRGDPARWAVVEPAGRRRRHVATTTIRKKLS
jgi:hypothetical protein